MDDLLGHMEWADALIWKAVLGSPDAADARLRDRLYHLHATQHAFLNLWRGVTPDLPAADTLDARAMAEWARSFYQAFAAHIGKFDDQTLHQRVPAVLVNRAEARFGVAAAVPLIGDTVVQVAMHSTYHRGQISARLRDLHGEPPLTEYLVWVWRGKPPAEWT